MSAYSTATTISPETLTDTVTSFLPFTTSFKFPSSCSTKYRLNGPSLMAFDPGYGMEVETDVHCGPDIMTTWWESGLISGTGEYKTQLSIGPFTCPVGWTTVASSTKDTSTIATMCCPSDYYLARAVQGSITGACWSDVPSGMVLTYGSTSVKSGSFKLATTTLTDSSTVGGIGMWGWNVEYQITSATSSATSTSTPTSTSATTTASSDTSGSNTGGGLSAGAKTGIGVGVGVGAIGVIALLVALWIFGRRGKKQQVEPTETPNTPGEMAFTQSEYNPGPGELHGNSTRELHGYSMPSELESSHSSSGRVLRSPVEIG